MTFFLKDSASQVERTQSSGGRKPLRCHWGGRAEGTLSQDEQWHQGTRVQSQSYVFSCTDVSGKRLMICNTRLVGISSSGPPWRTSLCSCFLKGPPEGEGAQCSAGLGEPLPGCGERCSGQLRLPGAPRPLGTPGPSFETLGRLLPPSQDVHPAGVLSCKEPQVRLCSRWVSFLS